MLNENSDRVPFGFSLMSIVSLCSRIRSRGLFARPLRLIRGARRALVVFYSVPETRLEPYEAGFRNLIEGVHARAARRAM